MGFIFEIFSKQRETMNKKAIRDLREIFKMAPNALQETSYKKVEFIMALKEEEPIDYSLYECSKFMMIAMLAMTPEGDE